MARKTYESRIEEAKKKIKEKPTTALREIGKLLVTAVRKKASRSKKSRTYYLNGKKIIVKPGRLKKSVGYWYRKKENDLLIGSKAFYAHFEEFGSSKNPKNPFLMPAVFENKDMVQSMIMSALKELEKDK